MRKVAIVMGSKSDLPVAEKAVGVLRDYGVQMEVRVLSAHRCPNEAREFAASAREGGFSVILAFAGMAAHLAGAMAANTTLPVIGVPCSGTKLDGMDALLSTVQMPSGIPVATVAVDGGKNAALLAVQIWRSPTRSSPKSWTRRGRGNGTPCCARMKRFGRFISK